MRRMMLTFVALGILILATGHVDAQIALRGGGGMIFDGSQLGGHVSLVLPFSSKPAGVMLAAEYYKDSGVTTVPISARGLYRVSVGEASVYLGLGSGFIYTKQSSTAANIINNLGTKALFTAVGGMNFKFSGPLGVFGEVTLDRALTSGATNNWAAKAGISLTLQD